MIVEKFSFSTFKQIKNSLQHCRKQIKNSIQHCRTDGNEKSKIRQVLSDKNIQKFLDILELNLCCYIKLLELISCIGLTVYLNHNKVQLKSSRLNFLK
jgi:SPX domain protein involved in polyphosphate accumulation